MILIAPNQPGFPDLTELLEARCGTRTWNYGAIMCDRFRGIRGDGRLTVSDARTLMGARTPSTRRLYASKWGVFVKESGSYRPDYLHRIVCSEFPAAQTG